MINDPDYLIHRRLPEYVKHAAERMDVTVDSFSDDWVLLLSRGAERHFVHGYRFDLNSSTAGYNANDKVAASALLSNASVPHVPHRFLGSKPTMYPVVIKPLHGTGGKDVVKISTEAEFSSLTGTLNSGRWAESPYVDIKAEFRVIMLDRAALLTYKKSIKTSSGFARHNLGQGATPELVTDEALNHYLSEIAEQAVSALGLRLAAVDIVQTSDGLFVLEVNDGIMMEYFARHSTPFSSIAERVYSTIVGAMFR